MKNETAYKAKQRSKEEQNSESRESLIKKGCLCLALRPEMLQIKNPDTDVNTDTVHKVKQEEHNSESRKSSIKKGCLCLALQPEMLQIKNPDTDTIHKAKQRPNKVKNSELRESSIKKGCTCLALRPKMLQIKKPEADMKTETVHKEKQRPKEEQNSESRESSLKKGCLCLALRPEMLQIKNPDTDLNTDTVHKVKQEEHNSESRESSIKKGCLCLALQPEMLQIKKTDTDIKTDTIHKAKQRPNEVQNSELRESSIKKGCICLALRPQMLQIKKPETDMKTETVHKAKQRPKEEQNSESRESSIKKGCLCLALRPEILQIKKPDTDIKTETGHKAKQILKEEQNSELKESFIKKGCPCLVLRPGVTSRKVLSVCSSSLSAGFPNTHKQKSSNQGLASPVHSKKPENWHSPCHYLHALRLERCLQKSKSRTENRSSASSDEKFDLSFSKIKQIKPETKQHGILSKNENLGLKQKDDCADEKFKCTLTCLYLPNFSKGKPGPVRPPAEMQKSAISRTVSLERFECESSWSSSAIINELDSDGESVRLYFDLPMELIRATFSDANSPVATAFVFEGPKNDNVREKGLKYHEAGRHVPFSMSRIVSSLVSKPDSPTYCSTPPSLKARNDFDAYLEAQSV